VAGVQFRLDGVNVGAEAPAVPAGAYEFTWNSSTVLNGPHVLAAIARDAAGNQRTASVSVIVANDTTPPTVTVTSPVPDAGVSGTITFTVNATDDVGVAGVQFRLDGVNVGAEAPAVPAGAYEFTWNSSTVLNGPHVLAAIARDAAGNQRRASASVMVANDATPPTVTVTSPVPDAGVSGTITFTVNAPDDVGVAGVQLRLDGVNVGAEAPAAPAGAYEFTWNSSTVLNGSHVLAAIARDAAGNQRTASVSVIVANDTTPPTVTVTNPVPNAGVSGTITFTVNATDDVGVAGVQLRLDGVNVGAEAPAVPAGAYEFTWNSSTVLNGPHVLTAFARQPSANQRTASVSVIVANDTTPPTVTLTSPADAATITETVTLEASALDDVGVVGVQFTLDGVNLGAEL